MEIKMENSKNWFAFVGKRILLSFVLNPAIFFWFSQIGFADQRPVAQSVRQLLDSGKALENQGNIAAAIRFYSKARELAHQTKQIALEATSLRGISGAYHLKSDLKNARIFGTKSLEISNSIHNENEIFMGNRNLGDICLDQGFEDEAMGFYMESLKRIDKIKNQSWVASLYSSLGNLNDNLQQFNKAISYRKLALEKFRLAKDSTAQAGSYSDIGIGFFSQNQYDSALSYYSKAVHLRKKIGDQRGLSISYNNIGAVYSKQKDFKKALIYFQLALKMIKPFGQKNAEAAYYYNIGECYSYLGDKQKAEQFFLQALKIGREIQNHQSLISTYKILSEIESDKGKYATALEYFKQYATLKDSIFNVETIRDVNEKIIKYESEVKDREIKILNAEKLLRESENKEVIANRNLAIALLVGFAVLCIFLTTLFYVRKRRVAQKEFLLQLIQSQENERKRISKELHDGIGQSLLVIKNNMTEEKSLIENTIEELRAISRNLHPIQLEKLGFKRAIESIVNEVAEKGKIYFSHEIEDVNEDLSPEQQINLYRIVQECISNIIKHSQATDARITVQKREKRIVFTIFDNGIGFSPFESKKKKSLGLTSMEERTLLINGELNIQSKPGETKVEIRIKYA